MLFWNLLWQMAADTELVDNCKYLMSIANCGLNDHQSEYAVKHCSE